MILFVFEGEKRESKIFNSLERTFFNAETERLVCTYNNNIYSLYKELQDYGGGVDIVALLRDCLQRRGDKTLDEFNTTSDFAEVFLFFDYDFQNKNLTLDEINRQVNEMLGCFDNETENGKLYINYPMIESIRYTGKLPDKEYYTYEVSRLDCCRFKDLVQEKSAYGNLDFITFDSRKDPTLEKLNEVRANWLYLEKQNVEKANFICNSIISYPKDKEDILQSKIFSSQVNKYVCKHNNMVAVLNSFPIFIYEYFK